jgi:hypothetical protein
MRTKARTWIYTACVVLLFIIPSLVSGAVFLPAQRLTTTTNNTANTGIPGFSMRWNTNSTVVVVPLAVTQNSYNAGAGDPVTITLAGVAAGAKLIVTEASASSASDATLSVSSSPALTWKTETAVTTSGAGVVAIFSTTFSAGGSISIYLASSVGSTRKSGVAYEIAGSETPLAGATNASTEVQSLPLVTIVPTRAGSLLFMVTSDLNSMGGSANLWDGAALFGSETAGGYRAYHYYTIPATTDSRSEGMTQPTSQASGTCVLEVRKP